MYPTPCGDRILVGAERRCFTHSLAMIVDLLADWDVDLGVVPFDQLQRNQKLVVLYQSARALLRPAEPIPNLTAFLESAVATVYQNLKDQVNVEIDDPPDSSEPAAFWRKLVLDAAIEQFPSQELPDDLDDDKDAWDHLVESLSSRVLWDNDYQWQLSMDIPPEESQRIRDLVGIDGDYYLDVPPDPLDDQVNLYVDALMGLTANAR